jgi:tripartite-type tricarboxylate transporter receptor subunit TctC
VFALVSRDVPVKQRVAVMRAFLIAVAMVLGVIPGAWAQSYPTHPVRLIVPFAPGGGTDAQARILADVLSRRLGQAFVVENMGGAGGTIGFNLVARADPDGYTILATTPAVTINPYIQKDIAYDPARDFAPVIQTTTSPIVLVVPADSTIRTVQDLIDMAKAKPGQVRYGSAGIGSIAHLSGALFGALAGVKLTHIPYRGSGPSVIDLMAGRLQADFENAPAVLPQIRGGQLRAVAVGTSRRSTLLPDLPTVAETVPGFESSSWFGILVPANTPRPVIDRLNAALNAGLDDPETQKSLSGLGVERIGGTPEAFGAYLKTKIAEMKTVAQAANLTRQ